MIFQGKKISDGGRKVFQNSFVIVYRKITNGRIEHLQKFAIPLGILKNLAKVAKNVLQQIAIHTCQNPSLAKTFLRACSSPRGGFLRQIIVGTRAVQCLAGKMTMLLITYTLC